MIKATISQKIVSGFARLATVKGKISMLRDDLLTPARTVKYATSANDKLRIMAWETINLNPYLIMDFMTVPRPAYKSALSDDAVRLLSVKEASAQTIATALAKLVIKKNTELKPAEGHYEQELIPVDSTGNWFNTETVWIEEKPAVRGFDFNPGEIHESVGILKSHGADKQRDILKLICRRNYELSERLRGKMTND